jgi:hypothetical protein
MELFISMNDSQALFNFGFRRETLATLARDFEKIPRFRICVPYILLVWGFECWFRLLMNWSGSRDLHPDRPLHGRRCCCYTTILEDDVFTQMALPRGLAPRAFSFARRHARRLHLESELVFLAGLAPAKHLDESQIARRLGAQEHVK